MYCIQHINIILFRCPASNNFSGVEQNETLSERHPPYVYPESLEGEARVEPDTPEDCGEDLAEGHKCQESCYRRIQNDETALASDVGHNFIYLE